MEFTWSDSYSVGIEQIDEQHKKLISLFQELSESLSNNDSDHKMKYLFTELAKYANYHFETEEEFFDMIEYPKAEEHIEEHRDFTQNLLLLYHEFPLEGKELANHLFNYLHDWLKCHILGTDQDFGCQYNKKPD